MTDYSVRLTFTDRRQGPRTGRSIQVQASNFPGAIAKASREFWKHLTTKERNDVRRSGIKVEARELQPNPPEAV